MPAAAGHPTDCSNIPEINRKPFIIQGFVRFLQEDSMPIYAYRCESCGFAKDVLQKMSDAPLCDCPECGKSSFKKQLTAAGFQLKGTGWYATDFKNGSGSASKPASTESAAAPASSEPASCPSGACSSPSTCATDAA
jgi:putative FmdB family regulatory protein